VASLFPGHSALGTPAGVSVAGVRESPKPPPVRVSLTFEAINRADQVWLLAAGSEKAGAVGQAFSGASFEEIPAVGVRGTHATIWLVDEAVAAGLP
jgi:6-phosphogluconolactonase